MKRRLILIFFMVSIMTFLVFPSVTYTESTDACSDNPYTNCAPGRKAHYGQLLGGAKYLKESFNKGNFSWGEKGIQNAPLSIGGYYQDENQYFKPLLAIMGAGLASVVLTTILYLRDTKQKSKQKI